MLHTGPCEFKSGKKYEKLRFSKCSFQFTIRFLSVWKVGNIDILEEKCPFCCNCRGSKMSNFLIFGQNGVYWHVLAHTGKGTKRTKGTIGKNEDFRTFSKRVRRRRRKKSNEEAHWLRQERLIKKISFASKE